MFDGIIPKNRTESEVYQPIITTTTTTESSVTPPQLSKTMEQELRNVLNLLPFSIRELSRNYIATRLKRIVLLTSTPPADSPNSTHQDDVPNNLTLDLTTLNKNKSKPYNPHGKRMLGSDLVPIIPDGAPTPKSIPGELIASHISKREIQLINESMFGPLKSVTMFPSVMSSILVFPRRYNPEKLAQVLKFNYGVEAEPNGLIVEAKK